MICARARARTPLLSPLGSSFHVKGRMCYRDAPVLVQSTVDARRQPKKGNVTPTVATRLLSDSWLDTWVDWTRVMVTHVYFILHVYWLNTWRAVY